MIDCGEFSAWDDVTTTVPRLPTRLFGSAVLGGTEIVSTAGPVPEVGDTLKSVVSEPALVAVQLTVPGPTMLRRTGCPGVTVTLVPLVLWPPKFTSERSSTMRGFTVDAGSTWIGYVE